MSINDVPQKLSSMGLMSMWTCSLYLGVHHFCTLEYTLGYFWHQPEKLYSEPSQIARVTNCDNSGILAVAICDLSQFVIKVETCLIESNNTENVFCVLGRVLCSFFTWIWKVAFLPISCCYTGIYVFIYISCNVHNLCTKENSLKWSEVYVNVFSVLDWIP